MNTYNELVEKLKKIKPVLEEKFGVNQIGIFGSYVRGEETENSDLDILVIFSKPIGWEFIYMKEYLENIFGMAVDLITVKSLRPQFRENILKEVVYA